MNNEEKIIRLLGEIKELSKVIHGLVIKEFVGCQHIRLSSNVISHYHTVSTSPNESQGEFELHKCLDCGTMVPVKKK